MAAEMIRMMCPNLRCKAILSVPVKARGKAVQCRQCGMRVKIPGSSGRGSGGGSTDNAPASTPSSPQPPSG